MELKMVIKYPEQLRCSFCKKDIRIDPDQKRIESNDILLVGVNVPISYALSDFKDNYQELGRRTIMLCVCVHCGSILGTYLHGY